MFIKSHKEAYHEGEKDSCDDCYYETGWKKQILNVQLWLLKVDSTEKDQPSENNHWDVL